MKNKAKLLLLSSLIVSGSAFAAKHHVHSLPSALLPGTKVVAGDLSKNEFFVVADANYHAPVMAAAHPKKIEIPHQDKPVIAALAMTASVKKTMQVAVKDKLELKPKLIHAPVLAKKTAAPIVVKAEIKKALIKPKANVAVIDRAEYEALLKKQASIKG